MNSLQKEHTKSISDLQIKKNNDQATHLLQITDKPKRGISVQPIHITNEIDIISNDNKQSLLSKGITQVDKDLLKNELITSSQAPKIILNHSLSPQKNILEFISEYLPPKNVNKKTLVLDLDETLVHSAFLPFNCPSDISIKINVDDQIYTIHVLLRPGLDDFLRKMAEKFELIIFTASVSKYADPLINILDKRKEFSYRLFREHCTVFKGFYTKDLLKLNRNMNEIIILDNSPISYAFNQDNGLPILSWFDDKTDCELINLIPILNFLSSVPDVREYIPKIIVNNEISYTAAKEVINEFNQSNSYQPCAIPFQIVSIQSNIIVEKKNQKPHQTQEQNKKKHNIKLRNKNTELLSLNSNNNKKGSDVKKITNNNCSICNIIDFKTSKEIMPSIINKNHLLSVNDQEEIIKLSKNNINTFIKNHIQIKNSHIVPANNLQRKINYDLISTTNCSQDRRQRIKHKKVESFTFGVNGCPFFSSIITRKHIRKSKQLSLERKNDFLDTSIDISNRINMKFQKMKSRNELTSLEHNLQRYFTQNLSKPFKIRRSINANKTNKLSRELAINNTTNKVCFKKENNNSLYKINCNHILNSESYKINETMRKTAKPLSFYTNNNTEFQSNGAKLSLRFKSLKNKEM